MPRLPKPINRQLRVELMQDDDGKRELARLERERKAFLDKHWPEPGLGDIIQLQDRLESERSGWADYVAAVRRNRFNKDETPPKWAEKLNTDRRFYTNVTANEINRVVGMMGRNAAKLSIAPAADTNVAVQRAEKQQRWGNELLRYTERVSGFPIWRRADDAAAENGLGGLVFFMTDAWEAVEKLIAERDPEIDDPELDKTIDDELRRMGCPWSLRVVDSLSLLIERDQFGISKALITERKQYQQIYESLRGRLSDDEFEEASLPAPGDRAWPQDVFTSGWSWMGADHTRTFGSSTEGWVETTLYLDRRWSAELVAGKIVECKEHKLPGVPVFPQYGMVTSSADSESMLQGIVNMGMLSQELTLNDLFTYITDIYMTYGRPFPVVETEVGGSQLFDEHGAPRETVDFSDPANAPQLGLGQHVVDAFAAFRSNVDPAFLQAVHSYWQMSGLNPIAQGDSPGSDPSGFAIGSLTSSAQALYEGMLDNKCDMLAAFVDFARMAVRDSIGETVYLSVPLTKGKGIEYIGLGPDDIDEVPSKASIDPMSDQQRLAITEWLITGMDKGLVDRRAVQTMGYGGVVNDPDDTDKQIILDRAQAMLLPVIVQSVTQQVIADAFPETMPPGPSGAPPPGGPGMDIPGLSATGQGDITEPAPGATVGTARSSPVQATDARARGGQQPANQGVPQAVSG